MASYLPLREPPRHPRRSTLGLPPAEHPLGESLATLHASHPPYYGREELARLCANWLMGVFGCPDVPKPPETDPTFRPKPLKDFIAYLLHRIHADSAVTFCALYSLNRLKELQPNLGTSSGHALFFAAVVVAAKVLPDNAYSNKALSKTTQGMFPLRNTNQLEHDFLKNLNWEVRPPDVETAREFEEQVRARYSDGPRPWSGSSRRHPTSTTPVATNGPRNEVYPYPVQGRRATDPPTHPSSQPQHTYPPRPPLRANTALAATSSASHSSRQARRYPNTPGTLPALSNTLYDSDSPPATPSPITPGEYQADPRARAPMSCLGLHVARGDHSYVNIPADAAFGSVAPRSQRRVRVQDIYASAR
ncbi:hypothetical protein LXA43DRAFT_956103 [Ganoderma leucocontextum]|nr:hypothetical protein LXA43DRAFT_956103 [Ganoderma leucocontextum]